MKTYLLLWNPNRWDWDTLESDIEQVDLTGRCSQSWSCGVTKSIESGDRIFLLRVGKEPKGIVGAGFASTPPFLGKHWSGEDRDALYIDVDFEVLLNADENPILGLDMLETDEFRDQNWHPQASGTSVKQHLTDKLEAMWFKFLNSKPLSNNPFISTDSGKQKVYFEGTPTEVRLTKYERNPYARKKCIEYYGYSCVVCGFNFEKIYGEQGREYIHVHHLEQIATLGEKYEVNPINDLRPVCANCHAMIHRRRVALPLGELKNLLG